MRVTIEEGGELAIYELFIEEPAVFQENLEWAQKVLDTSQVRLAMLRDLSLAHPRALHRERVFLVNSLRGISRDVAQALSTLRGEMFNGPSEVRRAGP